jgi:uncharacterized protein (DUF305 family)
VAAAVTARTARYGVALAALLAPVLLVGCGTEAGQPAAVPAAAVQAGGQHNATDVMFLQMMVAHHDQGLEMVRLAEKRADRSEVRTLARAVAATQTDEAAVMKSWLVEWSEPTTVDHAPSAHADHGGLPATGPEEIAALRKVKGRAFDTAFLNLFVAHQHNAVEMANLEAGKGVDSDTKALATRIRQSRTDQIKQMLGMLSS